VILSPFRISRKIGGSTGLLCLAKFISISFSFSFMEA